MTVPTVERGFLDSFDRCVAGLKPSILSTSKVCPFALIDTRTDSCITAFIFSIKCRRLTNSLNQSCDYDKLITNLINILIMNHCSMHDNMNLFEYSLYCCHYCIKFCSTNKCSTIQFSFWTMIASRQPSVLNAGRERKEEGEEAISGCEITRKNSQFSIKMFQARAYSITQL